MNENEHLKQIIYYKTENGRCPYDEWLDSLDNKIKSIIENRIEHLQDGLYGDHKKRVIKQADKYFKDFVERNSK